MEHTQQDFAECETLSALQPQPVTLGQKRGANLHQDATIDPRNLGFDIQIVFFPQEVTGAVTKFGRVHEFTFAQLGQLFPQG